MDYLYDSAADRQAMLREIGVDRVEDLFQGIPEQCRLPRLLNLPDPLGELELQQHMESLASLNRHAGHQGCFLGGGCYDHFVPSVVDAIASRAEFYTSYTPYQPEASQGNLQVMFEYQSLICDLTGMDVSNASLYDGGSAVAEAVLMCLSALPRGGRVVVPHTVHPEYREILGTYLSHMSARLEVIDTDKSPLSAEELARHLNDDTCCVVIQQPNFLGQIEALEGLADVTHRAGAQLIVTCDPISLGLLKRPGDQGADIVVAEGQSLGTPLSAGGPYLGILACRERFMRRMPGRIAGETVDRKGRRCWVLTLQTREQHIRREKATSNICTNQGLLALRAAIYLASVGGQGLHDVADLATRKAHYAAQKIVENDRFELASVAPFFKEFVVRDRADQVDSLLAHAAQHGILAGLRLGPWYPSLRDCFLVAVTEKRTRAQIDAWYECLTHAPVARAEAAHHA
jgi:glycine dehydrogenase subunit 1